MKKIIFFLVLIISIVIINNLIHSIYDLWRKRDLIANAELELTHQKEENQKLKSELSSVQSREFVEREARNKLFFVKDGEQEVLIDENLIKEKNLAKEKKDEDPNWKKWWELFF